MASSAEAKSAPLSERMTFPKSTSEASAEAEKSPSEDKSWADDVASPVAQELSLKNLKIDKTETKPSDSAPAESTSKSDQPQTTTQDAAVDSQQAQGDDPPATGLMEPDYDVEVKLSDIQADPNNPLYSIKSFEQLGNL